MEYRRFGSTELTVSTIGFGAWAIGGPATAGGVPIGWGEADDPTSLRALHRARDLGITFYDTADFYGFGHSEELIGQAFGNVAGPVVATKVGQRLAPDGSVVHDYSRAHITTACEASLRRLRRETIDLYQLHTARMVHLEQGECVEGMERLKEAGKIRAWGLSINTFAPAPEAEFMMERGIGNGFQLVLNIINQRARSLLRRAAEKGYGVVVRMPLQFGLLSGRITEETTFPPTDHRSFRLSPELLADVLGPLQEVGAISERLGVAPAALALGYCAAYPEVSTIIPGIRTPEQAEENAAIEPVEPVTRARLEDLYDRKLHSLVGRLQKQG